MALHWFTSYLTSHYSQNKKLGLDIGCGKKPYKQNYNCKYIGIDFPSSKNNYKPDYFADGEFLPFKDNSFDFITCFSVIPYVKNLQKFLNEIHRVMKNNGIAVFTIMNLKALSRDPDGDYPNKLSSKQLQNILKKHNFKSIKSKNLKALLWSSYFNSTSVCSYGIVKCTKNLSHETNVSVSYSTTRQSLRSKIIRNTKLYNFVKNAYGFYCKSTHNFHILPDFLIIGTAKGGTSSLYDYLMEHPCVGKSLTKQIHFFDRYFDRKISWYKVCFPFVWEKFFIEKIKKKKFSTGEATVHYMTHPLAAERAFMVVPNAKIIVLLRNPVDRAYSHYNMEKAHNKEELSFEEAIEKEPERIKGEFEEMLLNKNNSGHNYPHRSYIKSGEYLEQIKKWETFFPKENIFYIKSEEFNKNPSKIFNDVLEFLGLPLFKLQEYKKIRVRKYEKMNASTRKKLIEYFKPHNQKLYDFLNRDFEWN